MNDSLNRQVDGNHYKTMGMQPIVFTMQADYDACASYTLKHVARHDKLGRGGPVDLQKAAHYVELRSQLWGPWNYPRRPRATSPSITLFCDLNRIVDLEREFLFRHDAWVRDWTADKAADLTALLQVMCANRYPLFSLD